MVKSLCVNGLPWNDRTIFKKHGMCGGLTSPTYSLESGSPDTVMAAHFAPHEWITHHRMTGSPGAKYAKYYIKRGGDILSVSASLKCPIADGIACPGIARYNDHILRKGKDTSVFGINPRQQIYARGIPKRHGHCNKLRAD